jgi:hypothetical protein
MTQVEIINYLLGLVATALVMGFVLYMKNTDSKHQ